MRSAPRTRPARRSAALAVAFVVAAVSVQLDPATAATSTLTLGDDVVATGEARLTASDAQRQDGFGSSVAVDGDTAVVGAPFHPSAAGGAAYVFVRAGSSWVEQAQLTAPDDPPADSLGNPDMFGVAVAISGDTIVVGDTGNDTVAGREVGSVYVFVRTGDTWSEQARLSGDAAFDLFGRSVDIQGDTTVVGANGAGADGAAFVFVRSGDSWSEQAELTAPDAGPGADNFGYAVALEDDAIVVGGPGDSGNGPGTGSAHVFRRTGTTWMIETSFTAGSENGFGHDVALSGDTAVVGAPAVADYAGVAYVFVRSGTTWSEQAELVPADVAASDKAGDAVAVVDDVAFVGSPGDQAGDGSVSTFGRIGTTWVEQAELTVPGPSAGDSFGSPLAVSEGTLVVGAPGDKKRGAAYVFGLSTGGVPSLSVDDVSIAEGDSGRRDARFTISLSAPAADTVTVQAVTVSRTARALADFVPRTRMLSFAPGQTTATFDVEVNGDTAAEPDEVFLVRLDQPDGATIADDKGIGTIMDDD